eukprot:gnl/MRDRNA2_/MRDRNA2_422230_c0_seq1.p1 gnl/MRDRNA2_/MRDRNA2_422230_c0~~gnl/MRDRNA2_/MRDRNA2_422230_c0_seq1.p1  ORF type:complete len:205 (+),score=37.59 gnl/MRDRNA2_/MRDRNA2_422230_c0_seq1:31-615(+)
MEVEGRIAPYVVELDNGSMACAPDDRDDCIRLAARASTDARVAKASALSPAARSSITLRFIEADRVAVQLDRDEWEEGFVLATWTPPASEAARKAWGDLTVPYMARLDIGNDVLVPMDDDTVIRAESDPRPTPKSIAEILGGKVRAGSGSAGQGPRFVKHQVGANEWVMVDTVSGKQKACAAPEPNENESSRIL